MPWILSTKMAAIGRECGQTLWATFHRWTKVYGQCWGPLARVNSWATDQDHRTVCFVSTFATVKCWLPQLRLLLLDHQAITGEHVVINSCVISVPLIWLLKLFIKDGGIEPSGSTSCLREGASPCPLHQGHLYLLCVLFFFSSCMSPPSLTLFVLHGSWYKLIDLVHEWYAFIVAQYNKTDITLKHKSTHTHYTCRDVCSS